MKSYLKTHAFQLSITAVLALAAVFGFLPAEASALPMFALMAAPTFDITKQVAQGRQQNTRRVELHYHLDFNTLGDGTGLAQNEDAVFASLPAGYVHERLDAISRTAEGAATTLDVGTEATPTLFANALSMNVAANTKIQPETISTADADAAFGQPEADLVNEIKNDVNRLLTAGATYLHAITPVRVRNPGATLIDDAIIDLTFVGYTVDTTLEK